MHIRLCCLSDFAKETCIAERAVQLNLCWMSCFNTMNLPLCSGSAQAKQLWDGFAQGVSKKSELFDTVYHTTHILFVS